MARDLFAQRVTARRIGCGLSKSGLAREVGVTGTCVWNWEQGNTHPRPEIRAALARALRTTWAFLETGTHPREMDRALAPDPASLPVLNAESSADDAISEPNADQIQKPGTRRDGEVMSKLSSISGAPPSQGRATLNEGERELLSGLLSTSATFRLIVSGRVGVREIDRLIEKLEIDKEILAEDAENEAEGHHPSVQSA
jgi:DNA-binding XRE family transcriptional regulator